MFIYQRLVPPLRDLVRSLNLTPNDVTTGCLAFRVLFVHYYIKQRTVPALLCFVMGWVLDYVDGNYARETGMVTDIGDKYDHGSDAIFIVITLALIARSLTRKEESPGRLAVHYPLVCALTVFFIAVVPLSMYPQKVRDNEPIDAYGHTFYRIFSPFIPAPSWACLGFAVFFFVPVIGYAMRRDLLHDTKTTRPDLFRE